MKTYFVDFEGYCEIQADTYEEACKKFWELIANDEPLPSNVYEIQCVEEKEEA